MHLRFIFQSLLFLEPFELPNRWLDKAEANKKQYKEAKTREEKASFRKQWAMTEPLACVGWHSSMRVTYILRLACMGEACALRKVYHKIIGLCT